MNNIIDRIVIDERNIYWIFINLVVTITVTIRDWTRPKKLHPGDPRVHPTGQPGGEQIFLYMDLSNDFI